MSITPEWMVGRIPTIDPATGRLPVEYVPEEIGAAVTHVDEVAGQASASASAAAESAGQAQQSAQAAGASATAASGSAGAAAGSAGTANQPANDAGASASAAAESAGQAQQSAQAAGASATAASGSAGAAAGAQYAAEAARDVALAAVGAVHADGVPALAYGGVAWYEGGAAAPDTYQALDTRGQDVALLSGNTGYDRQEAAVPANAAAQSRMRRCILANSGDHVVYYLDADDSTKIAGVWAGGVQTGWVRVHEGARDPVRPLPGQATTGAPGLRAGVPGYAADVTYMLGDRVLFNGSLWDSLADNQIGVAPNAGTSAADLSGAAGQVMVEIPRFFYRWGYDAALHRHSFEVLFDRSQYTPRPLLTDAPDLPTTLLVNGRVFQVHPAFTKAGIQRRARYVAAFGTSATDVANNASGMLRSVYDGTTTNTTNISLANYTAKARNQNVGLVDPSGSANNVWQVCDNWLVNALQILFVTEYRTLNSQGVLGGGNISGSDFNKIAGRSRLLGNASGNFNASGALVAVTQSDTDGVAWRGIEDPWGTAWHQTAGGVIRTTAAGREVWLCNTPAQFADTGVTTGYEMAASGGALADTANWYYPSQLTPGVFLGGVLAGSSSTYLTDGVYLPATSIGSINILLWGASASRGADAGLFALFASYGASSTYAYGGASLAR